MMIYLIRDYIIFQENIIKESLNSQIINALVKDK